MFKQGDHVGITGCSDGLQPKQQENVKQLCAVLADMGLNPVCSDYLYAKEAVFSGNGEQRAGALMEMYQNEQIKAIFDITGGNVSNEILPYLDFGCISANEKPFFGYSDLTTVINSIYSQTGISSYLYTIQNLIRRDGKMQQERFENSFFYGKNDLFEVSWNFLRGSSMSGVVLGGNIRCLAKLAGTPWMPDFNSKILFLEAYSGDAGLIASLAAQFKSLGVFDKIQGILLGTFSYMEKHKIQPNAWEIILRASADAAVPVAVTREIGHGSDSKCLAIGKEVCI